MLHRPKVVDFRGVTVGWRARHRRRHRRRRRHRHRRVATHRSLPGGSPSLWRSQSGGGRTDRRATFRKVSCEGAKPIYFSQSSSESGGVRTDRRATFRKVSPGDFQGVTVGQRAAPSPWHPHCRAAALSRPLPGFPSLQPFKSSPWSDPSTDCTYFSCESRLGRSQPAPSWPGGSTF